MTSGYGIIEAYAEAKIPITTMNWNRVDVFLKKSDVDSIIPLAMQIDNRYYDDDPNQKFFNHTFDLVMYSL
ncbi:MAG: hypothetical protein QME25_09830 [Bacteroidota bacterium]|nr:hypothetical protein [Bacteroidota bacterium]